MSKKAKIAVVGIVVLVLVGVGGWFVHSSMVKKDYEAAWTGYEKEVKAWQDVSERYQVLVPVCGELAGASECGELKTAGEQAGKAGEGLALELKKASKPSGDETKKLEKATSEIKIEREKFEPAVVKVETAAEATIQDKFAPVLEEAEKKANEASGLVGSLKGKVKDENVLKALEGAAGELSSACGKWKGKDAPTGQEGVQAYLELKRLTLTCNDTVTKANESHKVWQAEQKPKGAYPGAGGARPANARPWPVKHEEYTSNSMDYYAEIELTQGVGCWLDQYDGLYPYCIPDVSVKNLPVVEHITEGGSYFAPANVIGVRDGAVIYHGWCCVYPLSSFYLPELPVGGTWYSGNYVLGRTNEGLTVWDTSSGHGFFMSNDGKRTETF